MTTPQGKAIVRQSTQDDIPFILECIQDLALYEKAPDAVKATLSSLTSTIAFADTQTSSQRPAKCLVCTDADGTRQAIAVYFYNYSTWTSKPGIYLEDLYVKERARNRGYGQLLLRALAKEVADLGGSRLDWSVLKWNKSAVEFYERLGAGLMDEWAGCRLEGEALKALAAKAE